jgi:hypothetical protein
MRGKQLKVTVEILTDFDDAAKKRSEGSGAEMGNRRIRDRRNK